MAWDSKQKSVVEGVLRQVRQGIATKAQRKYQAALAEMQSGIKSDAVRWGNNELFAKITNMIREERDPAVKAELSNLMVGLRLTDKDVDV